MGIPYTPHPDPRLEAAFQRFLRVLRGIQVLHNQTPNVQGRIYPFGDQSYWLVMTLRADDIQTTYCYVVHSGGTQNIDPNRGIWPEGSILGVSGGRPHTAQALGHICGHYIGFPTKEIPQGMLPEPDSDYFLQFCGPQRVGPAEADTNERRKKLIASAFAPVPKPFGQRDLHTINPNEPPPDPPPRRNIYIPATEDERRARTQQTQDIRWNQVKMRAAMKKDAPDVADIDWLDSLDKPTREDGERLRRNTPDKAQVLRDLGLLEPK